MSLSPTVCLHAPDQVKKLSSVGQAPLVPLQATRPDPTELSRVILFVERAQEHTQALKQGSEMSSIHPLYSVKFVFRIDGTQP